MGREHVSCSLYWLYVPGVHGAGSGEPTEPNGALVQLATHRPGEASTRQTGGRSVCARDPSAAERCRARGDLGSYSNLTVISIFMHKRG